MRFGFSFAFPPSLSPSCPPGSFQSNTSGVGAAEEGDVGGKDMGGGGGGGGEGTGSS